MNVLTCSALEWKNKHKCAIHQKSQYVNHSASELTNKNVFNSNGNCNSFTSEPTFLKPTVSSDDPFDSMGTWEDHATKNNLKVSKERGSRSIRRLGDIVNSDDEWKEPKLTSVKLIQNPFCAAVMPSDSDSDSGVSTSSKESKKPKRVCFNPSIYFHYYEPHNNY